MYYKLNILQNNRHEVAYYPVAVEAIESAQRRMKSISDFDKACMVACLASTGSCEYGDAENFVRITKIP